jgi:hypothetical protein
MTEFGVTVRHFAHRTRKNLRIIEQGSKSAPKEYFEVTQLVNSAIGLLMFPQQEFVESLPEWTLDDLRQRAWPIPEFEHGGERTQNLRNLTKNSRPAEKADVMERTAEPALERYRQGWHARLLTPRLIAHSL